MTPRVTRISAWRRPKILPSERSAPGGLARLSQLATIAGLLLSPLAAAAQVILPRLETTGQTRVGRTAAESGPSQWPQNPQAPATAPNVLLIMTDDEGFGSSRVFGGLIPTPAIEALAAGGARYNRFHTTAICSPTRASLLTGRAPHNVNMGNLTNLPTGYEGYTSVIPKTTGMIAETMRQNGYTTGAFGKWHITPEWEQSSVGPFERWPTGAGFDYFYGFHAGDIDPYAPALFENSVPLAPPTADPDYIFERDVTDRTIRWIRQQYDLAPAKPFFVYYAARGPHTPHTAPKEWLAKFRNKFDQGWDVAREQIFARQKALGTIPAGARLTPDPPSCPPGRRSRPTAN